jgi:hypothetical protein
MGTGDDVCDLSCRARGDRTTKSHGLGHELGAHPAHSLVGPAHWRKSRQAVAVIGGDPPVERAARVAVLLALRRLPAARRQRAHDKAALCR